MRWFKHLSRSHLDTSLCRLMDEFGLEGYGAYWLLLEAIAEQCDDSDNVTLSMSPQNWRKVLPFYPQRLAKFAQCLGNLQLFSVEVSNSLITISCPKLLKYRDEYTDRKAKKSGVYREKVLPRSDIDKSRTEESKTPLTPRKRGAVVYSESFLEFWSAYPKAVGKDAAFKSWQLIPKKHPGVKPPQIIEAIKAQVAADHFRGSNGDQFYKNPATWLNQACWNDCIKAPTLGGTGVGIEELLRREAQQ